MTTRSRRLSALLLAVVVGACADSSVTAPEFDGPGIQGPLMTIVTDPLDPNTQTHTFDDLPLNCVFNVSIPNPYEGLTFETSPIFAACETPNGTTGLIPADEPNFGVITEIFIDLPAPATEVSLDVFDYFADRDLTLNAYDGSGVLVGSASDPTDQAWVTLRVSGDIHRLGIATDQGNTYLDDLSITYAEGGEGGEGGDLDKDGCKDGGWEAHGFRNQGQCVRFVETGKDSR